MLSLDYQSTIAFLFFMGIDIIVRCIGVLVGGLDICEEYHSDGGLSALFKDAFAHPQ